MAKAETEETLKVSSLNEVTKSVQDSKVEAIRRDRMVLSSYNDKDLLFQITSPSSILLLKLTLKMT